MKYNVKMNIKVNKENGEQVLKYKLNTDELDFGQVIDALSKGFRAVKIAFEIFAIDLKKAFPNKNKEN